MESKPLSITKYKVASRALLACLIILTAVISNNIKSSNYSYQNSQQVSNSLYQAKLIKNSVAHLIEEKVKLPITVLQNSQSFDLALNHISARDLNYLTHSINPAAP